MGQPENANVERLVVYICDACSSPPCYVVTSWEPGIGPPPNKLCIFHDIKGRANWRLNGTEE